ncbi:MAG: sulfotransferase [Anaerolineae bacterium]|nr:sulfotransferase [Anaerolineae bacterium]
MEDHKFLFIGGLHRSGTTILAKCLQAHPQISGFENTGADKDEGQHLQSLFEPARTYGGAGIFGFHAAAYLDESSPLVTAANGEKLFNEWKPYWDLSKPVLLEKSLPNLIRTRFLQALFPQSYFLIVTRHPVATTLATKKWRPRRLLTSLFEHWFICYERLIADSPQLQNVFLLKYEDFVANPSAMIARISDFVGIDPMPVPAPSVRSNTNDKYFDRWQKLESNPFTRFYVRFLVHRFESRANQFGYSFTHLGGQTHSPWGTTLMAKEG